MSVFVKIDGLDELTDSAEEALTQSVASALEQALVDVGDEVTVLKPFRHKDWSMGERCPECNGTKINVFQALAEWYHSEGGEATFLEYCDGGGYPIDVLCPSCELTLYRHPAYSVLYDE